MNIYLKAIRDYQHPVLVDRNTVRLEGNGWFNGHTDRISGSATLLKYGNGLAEIQITVGEIPEW